MKHQPIYTRDLAGLIDWLCTKDPKGEYCYMSTNNCLLAQFFRACGYKEVVVGGINWFPNGITKNGMPIEQAFKDVAHRQDAETFGQALARAEALGHAPVL
jgi:hypothetical protein